MDTEQLKDKVKEIINSNEDELFKKLGIVAVVTEALASLNIKPIIVGGQAVEFYTVGGYATMDIDLICGASVEEIDKLLAPLGFIKEGKYWTLSEMDIAIEVPSGPLAGSWDKVVEVKIDDALSAYIIGIEDIIIDRLNRYKYWNEHADREWILGMIFLNYEDIDWDYLLVKAKEEKTIKEATQFKEEVEQNIK
ncbi:DUF6036 family nucleotidyltransferase [Fuchsiella alkaliacetigena]|uniref:DUF6036 family nucleotidyltransferase n=1 Tax=Fuchsiella alkaliacetigena TaxID=957042 RepID=UPI00200B4453|nr:DUF6036 family nucleotidyltransferase [Fuchsiella alkaliacetigena]MCK8824109.1 hypothetical protein [Fuchsiella alkaliacetigena]